MAENNVIELLCQLTHAGTLQQLCDLAYQITGNPVFISDMAHTILAYTKCVEISDETWKSNVIEAHLERSTLRQDRQVGSVHVNSLEDQLPVRVEDDYIPFPRIIKSLIREHRAVGVLVLTSYLKPLGEHDIELVELISSFVMPCLMRERYNLTDSKQNVENYLIKLLDGAMQAPGQIQSHLDVLGYQRCKSTYVLAFCNSDAQQEHREGTLEQMRIELSGMLRSPVFFYNSMLLCLYGCDAPIQNWPDQIPGLNEYLQRWGVIVGVSRRMTGLEQFRDSYLQAQAVLEKGRMLERKHLCYRFDSLSSYLLFDRIPQMELAKYCHEQIWELWKYDQEHDTELCVTLQVYLEQAKSLAKTADILYVHRNTVRYRVNRCMELLGNQLDNGNEIFAYILSLRILEYRAKIHHAFDVPAPSSF